MTVVYQNHAILWVFYNSMDYTALSADACGLPVSRWGKALCNPQAWLDESHKFQLDLLEIWP